MGLCDKSDKNWERFPTTLNSLNLSYTVPDGLLSAVLIPIGKFCISHTGYLYDCFKIIQTYTIFTSWCQYIGDLEQGLHYIAEMEQPSKIVCG